MQKVVLISQGKTISNEFGALSSVMKVCGQTRPLLFFLPRLLSIFTVQIQYNQYSKSLRSSPASLFRQNEHFATKKTLNTPPRGCDLGYCHPFTGRA